MLEQIIYLNGEFVKKSEAKVSVFDHGFLYGDGIFEGIRAYNGHVFRLEDHIRRLYDCAKVILLDIQITPKEMEQIVIDSCVKNNIADGYIRLVVSRGVGDLGLNPYLCAKPSVICIASSISLYPEEFYTEGLKIVTVATTRNFHDALNPRIKSLNYLNNIMAKIEAIQAGAPEALMLNTQGYVTECTGDNIFLIRDGVLYTPSVSCGALKGITRDVVMELAEKRGMKVKEDFLTRFDVYTAEECFLTGTAAEIIPVVQVDQRSIGDGKVGQTTKDLIADFKEVTKSDGPVIPL